MDDPAPRFSWILSSTRRGVKQAAFEIRVATTEELVRSDQPDVWASGRVASADPWAKYAGKPLASRTRYYWSVRVWTGRESPTRLGEAHLVRDGLPGRGRVARPVDRGPRARERRLARPKAKPTTRRSARRASSAGRSRWLTSGFAAARNKNDQGECRELRPAPMLRKSFTLDKPVRSGPRLRVAASPTTTSRSTAARVSDSVLDPGFTDYSKTVLYTTHDVTALLRQGENVIASELGSGHFDDATRTWDWGWEKAQWRATPRLRLDLHVDVRRRHRDSSCAPTTRWKVSVDGPTRYDSYYLGETYDARREIAGWDRPGFDDSALGGGAGGGRRPRARCARRRSEPIRVVDKRRAGHAQRAVAGRRSSTTSARTSPAGPRSA